MSQNSNPFEGAARKHSTEDVRFAQNPEYGSIPFRGEVPLMSNGETLKDHFDMVMETEVHVLDFSDPDDLQVYENACNIVNNGMGAFGYCDFQWVDEEKTWKVLITLQRYYREDKRKAKQRKSNMQTKGR